MDRKKKTVHVDRPGSDFNYIPSVDVDGEPFAIQYLKSVVTNDAYDPYAGDQGYIP